MVEEAEKPGQQLGFDIGDRERGEGGKRIQLLRVAYVGEEMVVGACSDTGGGGLIGRLGRGERNSSECSRLC